MTPRHPISPSLSVIIPAFNEAATLAEIVARVRASGRVEEIIVVDDGSTDATPTIAAQLANNNEQTPRCRVIRHDRNRGKGAAIRTALDVARCDVVLVQDADLEYDPAEYAALLAPFADTRVEAVYGSRNLRPNGHSSFLFYWGGRFLSAVTNALYGSRLTDESTGFKVVRTPLMRALDLREDGFTFCAELTGKLLRHGVRIHEVPVNYTPRTRAAGKKIRWRDGWFAIVTLVKCRLARTNHKRRDHDASL